MWHSEPQSLHFFLFRLQEKNPKFLGFTLGCIRIPLIHYHDHWYFHLWPHLTLIITISDNSESQSKRLDSDDGIRKNLSRFLVYHGSHQIFRSWFFQVSVCDCQWRNEKIKNRDSEKFGEKTFQKPLTSPSTHGRSPHGMSHVNFIND